MRVMILQMLLIKLSWGVNQIFHGQFLIILEVLEYNRDSILWETHFHKRPKLQRIYLESYSQY